MARATGYTCDRTECGHFEVSKDLPIGWIVVSISTDQDLREGKVELCSTKCLRDWSVDRYKAEREDAGLPKRGRPYPSKSRGSAGAHAANHVRHHVNKGVVKPGCPLCEEETDPQNGNGHDPIWSVDAIAKAVD